MNISDNTILLSQQCNAPQSRVWDALVHPQIWWGKDIVLEPEIGGVFRDPWKDANGTEKLTEGIVTDFVAPKRLSIQLADSDWDFETLVTFVIKPDADASVVELTHENWNGAPDTKRAELIAAHTDGWTQHLNNLATCATRMDMN